MLYLPGLKILMHLVVDFTEVTDSGPVCSKEKIENHVKYTYPTVIYPIPDDFFIP